MTDFSHLRKLTFNREEAVSLYSQYLKTNNEQDAVRVLKAFAPKIESELQHGSGHTLCEFDRDEAFSAVVFVLWRWLIDKKRPLECLTSYMQRLIVNATSNFMRRELSRPALPKNYRFRWPEHFSLKDVENEIFLEELPGAILNQFIQEVRFTGKLRDACIYIAECLLTGYAVDWSVLYKQDIFNAKFFVSYVTVTCRRLLWDYREEHKDLLYPEDASVLELPQTV